MNDIQAAIKELQAKAQKYDNEYAALSEAQRKSREAEFLKKIWGNKNNGRKYP